MPFDGTPTKLMLSDLAWRLRNPETWPTDFEWLYEECHMCAMGLALSLLGRGAEVLECNPSDSYAHAAELTRSVVIGTHEMSEDEFDAIFRDVSDELEIRMKDVTPEHVADAIDLYLARVP